MTSLRSAIPVRSSERRRAEISIVVALLVLATSVWRLVGFADDSTAILGIARGESSFGSAIDSPSSAALGADVAVAATVAAIHEPTLNTPDGGWDGAARGAVDLHALYSTLVPWTEIELTVDSVLGATSYAERSGMASAPKLVLALSGGKVVFTVTQDQAAEIGLRLQPPEPSGSLDGLPSPPGAQPTEPLELKLAMSYAVGINVGDQIVVFIRRHQMRLADGTQTEGLVASTPEGGGVYIGDIEGDGTFTNAVSLHTFTRNEILEAAQSLSANP